MSHLGKYKSKLLKAEKSFAKQAMEELLKDKGLKSVETHKNRFGVTLNKKNCNVGITSDGIGVNINKENQLEFLGDKYGHAAKFNKTTQRYEQIYNSIVAEKSLKKQGMRVQRKKVDGRIRLVARA